MIYALDRGIFVPQQPCESIASRFGPWYRKAKRIFSGALAAFQDFPVYDPTTGLPMYSPTQGGVPMYGCEAAVAACVNCTTTPHSWTVTIAGMGMYSACASGPSFSSMWTGNPNFTFNVTRDSSKDFSIGGSSFCIYDIGFPTQAAIGPTALSWTTNNTCSGTPTQSLQRFSATLGIGTSTAIFTAAMADSRGAFTTGSAVSYNGCSTSSTLANATTGAPSTSQIFSNGSAAIVPNF